ncbi:Ig-like domain-containing protein [Psychrosphaera aquimarina]|uniref:Ig-like domain-containing protein n=1 Tax=Psychrosphaera aquimarina TaxID=2044854 RepID=A0ABU3QW84_9GAMM|nr:Ig-like domain-containing protein [Psychrosphaera aquimarina]MDU0111688.1 Ig-like domain-containing protein [Psychrosphaera aquimarina]
MATWSSQNINVAEFNQASSNILQGISAGSVYITASYTPTGQEELTSETQVTVEPAILRSISIHPTTPRFTEIPQNTPLFLKGNTDLLTATGLYSDGTTATINGSVDWSIDNTNVAYISSVGVITPVGLGDATLHVEIDVVELGETKTIYVDYPFTVIGPLLKFIDITPATPVFILGMQQQFTAKGIYSDNSIVDLTNAVTWTTGRSNESAQDKAGNITNTGVFSAERLGSVTVNASHPDFDDKAIIKQTFVSIETLDHLVIEHAGGDVYAGQKLTLNAYGVTSNNKQVTFSNGLTWQVSAIATIDDMTNQSSTNSFTTNAAGVMTATATWTTDAGVTSKSIQIDIKDPLLTSISLSVDDNSIADGLTAQFTATGTYSDGSTKNITDDVSWNNLNESIFTISNTGLITSKQPGSGDVSVYLTNDSGNKISSEPVLVTIELPLVESLNISASTTTISRGTSLQLNLTGILTDGSTELPDGVSWNSDVESNAVISDSGLVTIPNDAVIGQMVTLTALVPLKEGSSDNLEKSIVITIGIAKLSSLTLSIDNQTVPRGSSTTISATGLLTDETVGLPTTVNWTSSDTSKATVDSNGLVTVVSNTIIGQQVTITATAPELADSTNYINKTILLTIGKPLLSSISLTSNQVDIPRGTKVSIVPTGTQSDGTSGISTTITWNTNEPTISTVSSSGEVFIRNNATLNQNIVISATASEILGSANNISQSITLKVVSPLLSSMTLTTDNTTVPRGTTATVSASGTYTDATTKVPDSVVWTSSDTFIATVDSTSGEVTIKNDAVIGQQVTITATAPNGAVVNSDIVKTITLTVGQPLLTSMALAASDVTNNEVPRGTSTTITPTGTQSDLTNDIATAITWTTSDASIATVDANGKVTIVNGAAKNETVMITATANKSATNTDVITQSITLTVIDPLLSSMTLSTDNTTIPRGTTATVSASGTYTDATTKVPDSVVWTSSDTSIVTVDSTSGEVTIKNDAVIGQQVTITATAPNGAVVNSDIVKTITLTVGQPLLTSMALAASDVTNNEVPRGTSTTITPTGTQSDSTNDIATTITWTSSDASKATVDANGKVTIVNGAAKNETVMITATANKSATNTDVVTQSITLTVIDPLLSSMTLSTDNTTIPRGTSATVSASGTYTDATTAVPSSVVWTSSDTTKATVVSGTGVVTIKDDAVIGQQVIITATAPNGGIVNTDIVKTINLTVGTPLVETLDILTTDSDVRKGRSLTLTKSVLMSDGNITSIPTLTWSSSNSIIATVDSSGVVQIPNSATVGQTATITLSAPELPGSSTDITDSITITVTAAALDSISLSPGNSTVPRGKLITLTATGSFSDSSTGSIAALNPIWSSDDETLATVDVNGNVTILDDADIGQSVVISVIADEAVLNSSTTIPQSVTLTVGHAEVESIEITENDLTLARGKTQTLNTTITMSDSDPTSEPTLTWSSSSPNNVSVDVNGIITVEDTASVLTKVEIKAQSVAYPGSSNIVSDSIFVTVGAPLLESISLSPGDSDIRKGKSLTFIPTGTLTDGASGLPTTLTWSSDDESVATVSDSGVVTIVSNANENDTATITVSALESTGSSNPAIEQSVVVTAIAPLVEKIEITVNSVSKPTDNVAIGGSLQLGTLTTYSNGDTSTSATVIWEEVVDSIHGSVSTPGGLVTIPNTAIADEKLYIAVSTPTYDGSVETVIDSIELTIIDAVLASIQLNSGDVSIIQGNTLEVVATGTLTNGSSVDAETLSSTLTWSTNNVGEVDVSHISSGTASAHGLISVDSAASIGDSIITATDVDGVSTSITVTVAYPKVELALSSSETDILVEDTITITPTFTTTSDSITDIRRI